MSNSYYPRLKVVVDSGLSAFADKKITVPEIWTFMLALSEAVQNVLAEAGDFSDGDLADLKVAANMLYDEYILPLDIPGPDWFVDPLLRNGVMPGLVEASFKAAKRRVNG